MSNSSTDFLLLKSKFPSYTPPISPYLWTSSLLRILTNRFVRLNKQFFILKHKQQTEKAYRRKCILWLFIVKSASNFMQISIQKVPERQLRVTADDLWTSRRHMALGYLHFHKHPGDLRVQV